MPKTNDTGIFEVPGGYGYRINKTIQGKKRDYTSRVDEITGKPYATKKAAREAREAKLIELLKPDEAKPFKDVTLQAIYEAYSGSPQAKGKAPATLRKQESLWKNHVGPKFGDRLISEITLSDLQNYLQELYDHGDEYNKFEAPYAYQYVQGVLRFFYLLFGEADRRECIDPLRYRRMFETRKTRLEMPKITQADAEDAKDIKAYNELDIRRINSILKDGNGYTAFMLGYHLGVRISECYALRWSDIDWSAGTITINKQMHDEPGGGFSLYPVKTLQSVRVVDMGTDLQNYLYDFYRQQEARRAAAGPGQWMAWEVVMDKTDPNNIREIQGGDFINRTEKGKLCTVHSMRYWAREIARITQGQNEGKIDFHYHSLRKTHATMMANLNTPAIELMNRLGHKKYETTLKYYLNQNALSREILKQNLDKMTAQYSPSKDKAKDIERLAKKGAIPDTETLKAISQLYDPEQSKRERQPKIPRRADGSSDYDLSGAEEF